MSDRFARAPTAEELRRALAELEAAGITQLAGYDLPLSSAERSYEGDPLGAMAVILRAEVARLTRPVKVEEWPLGMCRRCSGSGMTGDTYCVACDGTGRAKE